MTNSWIPFREAEPLTNREVHIHIIDRLRLSFDHDDQGMEFAGTVTGWQALTEANCLWRPHAQRLTKRHGWKASREPSNHGADT